MSIEHYRCTRCDLRHSTDCEPPTCDRGPCPMELVDPAPTQPNRLAQIIGGLKNLALSMLSGMQDLEPSYGVHDDASGGVKPELTGLILKGIGRINGDGWKDVTSKGEVVFAWNRELPKPYAPGQYPRVGHDGWTASTSQYDFVPATVDEVAQLLVVHMPEPTVVRVSATDERALVALAVSHGIRFQTNEALLAFATALRTTGGRDLSLAARDVLAERCRQVGVEGWTHEHDDEHSNGEMATAAACYAMCAGRPEPEWLHPTMAKAFQPPKWWPWAPGWWKPRSPRKDLVKAGALVLAEIERIDRAVARLNERAP